ncbi:FAD dependent oxidoreductase superfamily protein [Colletotrichum graminicola]|uniref:FAD dependent oxidoreductase superfamily protein n=1 Tax=Colletotrichum graminicola (strain M1.001 / M2 / FGSC 10212) TaxID=645133 RepID=E3Q4F4_COLGM|nr:FAD dependent oxidoreductase superfamily protein [Colletotrichum graminicola M1.001]EFQ25466.1 FAD dependent oxidoreductase superfamily protein [Colletotrichum graminicola M1.001]WDK11259.1 FAD dependent oxidoreductase superfamily protein [Colletotrichum graminicola]
MESLRKSNTEAYITFMPGIEYLEDPWRNTELLLKKMRSDWFLWNGGKVSRKEISDLHEVFTIKGLPNVLAIINCSGLGFGHKKSSRPRGRCVPWPTAKLSLATVTRQDADGSWTPCVPRNFDGGAVIGGTKEPDNWDPEPSLRVQLLEAFADTYPHILEDGDDCTIVRAYDLGGRGFEFVPSTQISKSVLRSTR